MDKNEIKTHSINISLKDYLSLDNVITKNTFQIGNIKYYKSSIRLLCKHNSNNTYIYLLGKNSRSLNLYLFELPNGIMEYDINNIYLTVDVVLKKQIENLKYVEQLNLFEDGERQNSNND